MAEKYDVIVIGGGASGMMAAGRAAEKGRRVLLLEKNAQLGEKLAISGGGRCNILNAEDDQHALLTHYGDSAKFLYSPFSQFGMQGAYDFFESRGLPLKVEARKRAFPVSEKASDVVQVLADYMRKGNVDVRLKSPVEKIVVREGSVEGIRTRAGTLCADSYVIACGGVSHPETGSTGDGFGWLSELGIPVRTPTPTIVPLRVPERWVRTLSGTTLHDVRIIFFAEGVRTLSVRGGILLTHFGISGPTILNVAGKVAGLLESGNVSAKIDTYPDLDLGILEKKIIEIFDNGKNKSLKNIFREIAPPGAGAVILENLSEIDPDTKVHSITKDQRRSLALLLKALPITISGLMGFDRAVVADGGVPPSEVDTRTMRLLKHPQILVTGDMLHITRPSGGYSLQIAWTTGYVAGEHS